SDRGPNFSHIHYGTSGDWYIRSATNGGQVVLEDVPGNVGIGNSAPAYKLDVNADAAGLIAIHGHATGNGYGVWGDAGTDGRGVYGSAVGANSAGMHGGTDTGYGV